MDFIHQMEPWFDDNETQAVYEYMRSGGWVTEFLKTREFEKMIAEYTGARYCSVVNNGTISLTLALLSCGIGPGDEVIIPDFTMVASANAVKLAGANVVFVDICLENLCMDFDQLKEALSPHTKAVMLVTINGRYPENIEEFVDFCRHHGLKLIEDAAQSLGSKYNGKHLGTFGDIGSFSFSAPKVITTGQGGALVTNNQELFKKISMMKDFGRNHAGVDYHEILGFNAKFTDLQAVVGLEQMKKLNWRVERKRQIYKLYKKLLEGIEGLEFIKTNLQDTSPWFIDILVKDGKRDGLASFLKEKGIGTRPFYPPLHTQPFYSHVKGNFKNAESISQKGLWLPSSSFLSDKDIELICQKMQDFFRITKGR